MFNKQCKVKLIAASLGLAASLNASAAMGGLQVQSNLDEPFSGTVVVTGDEARALAGSAKPAVIGANLTATVTQQGSDRAVIRLRSSAPMKEPVVTFWLGVGNQNRQYTAMLDPKDYQAPTAATQPARRAAQEASKPNRERAAEQPRRQAERERNRSRQAPASSGRVEVVRGSRYQVKDGELLVDIAQRIQPAGMTLRQTINALVRANPKSFRNGNPDLMYSGTTLIIPEAAQLRRLARDSQIRVRPGAEETAAPPTQVAEQAAPAPQPAAETQAPPATPEPAAKPAETAEPVAPAASEPMAAPPVEAAASEAGAVSEAAVSEAATAEVSEPVAPPVAEPAPMPAAETPAVQEEQPDWMKWALYGAGGAVVLGGLAYLLSNRRRKPHAAAAADGTTADDEDDLFFEDIDSPAPVADKTAPATVTAADAVKEDDLHLDLDQLAEQQHLGNTPDTETVAAEAEAAAEEDDWSWLEDQADDTPPASASPAATAAVVGAAATTAAAAAKSADDWLDFGDEALPAAQTTPVAEPAPEAVADDLAWVWEDDEVPTAQAAQEPAVQAEPEQQFVAEPTQAVETPAEFDFDLSVPADTAMPVAEVAAPVEAEPVVIEEDAGLSFDVDMPAGFDDTAHAAPQEAVSFETTWQPEVSAAEVSALDFSVGDSESEVSFAPAVEEPAVAPGFDEQPEALDFSLDSLNFVDDAAPAAVQVAEEAAAPVQVAEEVPVSAAVETPAAGLSFDTAEVQAVDPAKLEAEALDWAEAVHQPASLPQEALEAKLELAKMYLEIDDANTARQTLMELVNESNGSSIQAQAKALLQELG